MPTAPMNQRQVTDQPFPNVRVGAVPSPEYYGAQVGSTVESAAVRMYDLENRAANQTAVFEADRQLADKQTQLENQLYATKGKQVLGADQMLFDAYDQHVEAVDGTLSNDQQRGAFRHTAALRRQQLNDTAQKYIRQEYGQFQDAETDATLKSTQDRVRNNPDSPLVIKSEMARAQSAVAAWAQRKGFRGEITPEMLQNPTFQQEWRNKGQTPPTLEEMQMPGMSNLYESQAYLEAKSKVQSGLHKSVVDGFLAQDKDQSAKQYFDANKKQFTAGDLDAVEKNVLEGSTRGESRRLVQNLIAQHGMDTPQQQQKVLSAIRALPESQAKVADLAEQRALHQFSVNKEQTAQAYTNQFMAMSAQMDQTWHQNTAKFARDLYPPNVWNTLKPDDQHALELKLGRLRDPNPPHDPRAWFDFQSLTDDKLAAVKPNDLLGTYLNKFDAAHYDRALTQWNAARDKAMKGEKEPKYLSALTPREMIMNGWKESGIVDNSIPRGKWTANDELYFSRFEDQASRALSALPKDAKPEEIQKVIKGLGDSLLKQKYTVDPGFFSRNKQVPAIGMGDVNLKDVRSVRVPVEQIPAEAQDQIKGLITLGGKAISQDKIERIYALQNLHKSGQMEKEAAKAAMKAIILE